MTTQERVEQHYNEITSRGYEVVGVFLQGSQNYKLEHSGSDVDTKAILLPSFDDFCLGYSPISTTHVRDNNEHTDLKDVRLMFECFKKQNINFIEILFTDYKVINPKYQDIFQPMLDNRELIARYNNYASVNALYGMVLQKYKALEHPYPSLVEKIEKFGYDPKQLHHILRLSEFMVRYINEESYQSSLISNDLEYLLKVKLGYHSLEEARVLAKEHVDMVTDLKQQYLSSAPLVVNGVVPVLMNQVLVNLIKRYYTDEFQKVIK